jgi:hypothetical protein
MKKLFLLLPAILLLAGCQTTPDKPVVVQKDMEQMIEKGMSSAEAGSPPASASAADTAGLYKHYGVPERFKAQIKEGKLAVSCDAQIELPDTERLPMARVVAAKFPQEKVYAFFKALCGDTPMYIVPQALDKSCYQEAILEHQAMLAKAKDKNLIKSINRTIEDLKKQYAKAPDSIDMIPSDGTLRTVDLEHEKTKAASGKQTILETTSDPRGVRVFYGPDHSYTAMQFTVYNDVDYEDTSVYAYKDKDGNTQIVSPRSGSQLVFLREGDNTDYGRQGRMLADVTELSLSGGAVKDCMLSTTPKQAREKAEQFMAAVGLNGTRIDKVSLYSSKEEPPPAEVIERREKAGAPTPFDNGRPETQAYVFRLLRVLNGVKVESDHDCSETKTDDISYGREWMYEMFTIAVDDKGIANVFWTGPLQVTKVLTEDTKILPWSDIQGVFEKMIVIQNATNSDYFSGVRIDITHTSLSLERIVQRDSFTEGLLVPVWNFYGTTTLKDKKGVTNTVDNGYNPLISINAIDGSVIDLENGY